MGPPPLILHLQKFFAPKKIAGLVMPRQYHQSHHMVYRIPLRKEQTIEPIEDGSLWSLQHHFSGNKQAFTELVLRGIWPVGAIRIAEVISWATRSLFGKKETIILPEDMSLRHIFSRNKQPPIFDKIGLPVSLKKKRLQLLLPSLIEKHQQNGVVPSCSCGSL